MRLHVFTVRQEPMLVARISASLELRDVQSSRSAFQVMGPPD